MPRSFLRVSWLVSLACGLLIVFPSRSLAEPKSIGFSKMVDGAEVIAVARLAGTWDPGEWHLDRKNGGSLELELTRILKGDVKPGRYRAYYDDRPWVSADREFVAFFGKGLCWRFAAHPISEANTLADGVLRVAGFYDYNAYMVSPGLVTLPQIETLLKDHTLTYTVRGPLYFPKHGQPAWEASQLTIEVKYDARTGKTAVHGLPEPKGFSAQPTARISPYLQSDWILVNYFAAPDAHLMIEGQIQSADAKTGALLAKFFVTRPTVLTLADFEDYLADPLKGDSYSTITILCNPLKGELWCRKLRLTLGEEKGRLGTLEGWSEENLRLERYGRGPTEGDHETVRATAKLGSGEELELRFDCGPKRETGNYRPSELVHLLAAGDIPGRVLLRDGQGERELTAFTASLGKVQFTRQGAAVPGGGDGATSGGRTGWLGDLDVRRARRKHPESCARLDGFRGGRRTAGRDVRLASLAAEAHRVWAGLRRCCSAPGESAPMGPVPSPSAPARTPARA
jgi:hypothetical protein